VELVHDTTVACVQNHLSQYINQNVRFTVSAPNGMNYVKWVSFNVVVSLNALLKKS